MDAILTDSHTHLDDRVFEADLMQVIARAHEQGVERMVTVGSLSGVEGATRSLSIARVHKGIWATLAIHPHEARLADGPTVETIERLARDPKVVAIGETGLDYHYDLSPRAQQREVFETFIRMALRLGKPLVIHTREAMEDTLRIMDDEGGWEAGGVFHCYSGDTVQTDLILSRGFYLSFAGVVTFKKSYELRDLVGALPRDRVLIETDAPYLTPVPYRGKRNEPANVRLVARTLADLWAVPLEEAARITSDNAARLFGLET